MEYICKPKRIQIYINTKHKDIEAIKKETGCTAIINGGLYTTANFSPVCQLRVDGKTLADDGYGYWGYGWDIHALTLTADRDSYKNYIAMACLVRNGQKEDLSTLDAALKGSRQRTAIGTFADGRVWVFAQKSPTLTPEALQALAISKGLKDAVMLDGGASTQCILPSGTLTSKRKVHNYILIYENEETDMVDIEYMPATNADVWKENRTITVQGLVLHSTAMPGKDAYAIQKNFNVPNRGASIQACVDDKRVVQLLPWNKRAGHVGAGSKGSFNNSHIGVEMCEPSGLVYNSIGNKIVTYNPPKDYFENIWNNAVDLFAYLCKQYNLDPLGKNVIVSHAEAHALGYGDNHADTGHWFVWENKTMDDFRKAVYNRMNGVDEDDMTYEKFKEYMDRYMAEAVVSDPSSWAKDACEKAVAKGIMKGDGTGAYNFQKPLTREAYLVMQDRQGLL